MKVRILSAADLPEAAIARWEAIQRSNPLLCSPFFRPEFTQAVALGRHDVHVALIDEEAGFFPFQSGRLGFGRPVGGPMSDYHGLIAEPDAVYDGGSLIRACGLQAWTFDHLPAGQTSFSRWSVAQAESPILDLTAGTPVCSKEQMSQFARKRRKCEREVGSLEFEMSATDPEMLDLCVAWKSAQYRKMGTADLFARQWSRTVVEALSAYRGDEFAGVTSVLRFGGRPVAAHFGIRARGILHWWFPAYDPVFSTYSPGILLLLEIISAAQDHGISTIDFGKGDAQYKRQFANRSVPLMEGTVSRHRWLPILQQGRSRVVSFTRSKASSWPIGALEKLAKRTYRSWRNR